MVLIKGMKMPECCDMCEFRYHDQDSEHLTWWRCAALNHREIRVYVSEKWPDCPLVEIPFENGHMYIYSNGTFYESNFKFPDNVKTVQLPRIELAEEEGE